MKNFEGLSTKEIAKRYAYVDVDKIGILGYARDEEWFSTKQLDSVKELLFKEKIDHLATLLELEKTKRGNEIWIGAKIRRLRREIRRLEKQLIFK